MSEEVLSKLGRIEGKIDSIGERIERHDYAIYGNGTPGLSVRMDRAEQHIRATAKSRKAVWGAVLSVLGAVGSLASTLFGGGK